MKFSKLLVGVLSLFMAASIANADAIYPYQNPTYIPTAISPPVTYSAPSDYGFTLNGVSTVSLRVSGTCTSLAAVAQGSNDGTNWTTINLYPVATGTSAPTAVASISAAGFWKSNVAGFSQYQLHITALSTLTTCTVAASGTHGSFNGTTF